MTISSVAIDNLINTGIAFLSLMVIYLIANIVFIRKIERAKERKKIRIRTFYVVIVIFLFILERIWVEGFAHLITVLGLVSVGLVVTNKETIMNIVGWMIITWRGVFSEDDLIQIQQYRGFVKSIGLLYFTLQEVSDSDFTRFTGKEVKVPNGLTANNPIINYSQTARLLLHEYAVQIPFKNFDKLKTSVMSEIKDGLKQFYKDNKAYTQVGIQRFDRSLKNKLDLDPKMVIGSQLDQEKPVPCTINFYCFAEDKMLLLNLISEKIIKALSKIKTDNAS